VGDQDGPAASFHNVVEGAEGLLDPVGIADRTFFDDVMIDAEQDDFVLQIGLLHEG
jgi:hypothetical protein